MMAQLRETDYDIELLDGGVRVIFRPTASEFTYRQLADPGDIAREGPLARSPNVRHAARCVRPSSHPNPKAIVITR
jgi:hypothetical protein